MKKILSTILSLCFFFSNMGMLMAKPLSPQAIDRNIQTTIYSYKKMREFVAVEIGFTNTTNRYVSFSPKEIYLNDRNKYSVAPLPSEDLEKIQVGSSSGVSAIPLIAGILLGVASIATSGSNDGVSEGLAIAALSMGGAFIISAALEASARDKKLITFKNNTLRTIKKLPPGMTLGGFLYFPKIKRPVSVTVVSKTRSGSYQRIEIPLKKVKKPRKTKNHKYQRN